MLEKVVFGKRLKRSEYKRRYDELSRRLMVLQQMAKFSGLGVVALFEGWDSAGKGSRISDLVVNLDSRLFRVHTIEDPVGYEPRLPFMARFWNRVGAHGTTTVFDQGWYDAVAHVLAQGAAPSVLPVSDVERRVARVANYAASIRSFERQLADDGYLIVKFFLHITEEEQRRRFSQLMLDPESSWRVTPDDVGQVQRYDTYYRVFDRLLEETDLPSSKWELVAAHERRNANIQIMEALVGRMEAALAARGVDVAAPIEEAETASAAAGQVDHGEGVGDAGDIVSRYGLVARPRLDAVRHDLTLEQGEYKAALKAEQQRLSRYQRMLYRLRIPMVIAFEGWDAAGKGGAIKRIAAALDARSYAVHPVSAPSGDELAHPFLWRFWKRLPRTGHIAIFDRSWYGRVLVERVEGFATSAEWRRAYDEINDFEAELERWGAILVKIWVDVSDEEQLRRFREREAVPEKRWKITPEDWRNREKNDLHRICADDMMRLTSTHYAPWHIVESDDKRYARVKALRIVNEAIEAYLRANGEV